MEIDGAQGEPIIGASLLLLAGGQSRRMGRPKSLLPVGGLTLIEWQVRRLAGAFAETLVAVASLEQVPPALRDRAVLDRRPGLGPLAGLDAGLAAATEPVVFALACDVPSLTAAEARELVDRLAQGGAAVVPRTPLGLEPLAAAYRRDPARAAVAAALAAGELRLTALLERLEVVYVDREPLPNLNSPSDYESFLDN